MNISISGKNKTQNTTNEDKIQLQQEDTEILSSTNSPFSHFLSQQITENSFTSSLENLRDIDFSYDAVSMDLADALFFVNLTNEGQFSVQSSQNGDFQNLLKTEINQNIVSQKTINVTEKLTSLIEKAHSTQKPVRISFDNNISVILKIDKHGKISAEFIPGSIEAEQYLMANVASLKQKFDEQNLPYNNLSYRQNQGQRKNKDKNKGEA